MYKKITIMMFVLTLSLLSACSNEQNINNESNKSNEQEVVMPTINGITINKDYLFVDEDVNIIIELNNPDQVELKSITINNQDYQIGNNWTNEEFSEINILLSFPDAGVKTVELSQIVYETNKTLTINHPNSHMTFTVAKPIKTASDLLAISNYGYDGKGKLFILMNDIDLSSYSNWTPINNFHGIFDGNGHVISNMNISFANGYSGLFERVSVNGVVKNLKLSNVSIIGNDYVGAVTGYNEGMIENIEVTTNITGTDYVGGIVGRNKGTVTKSSTTGSVIGAKYVGGSVGYNDGTIMNVYSLANITGNRYVGGIAGMNNASVRNTFSTGDIQANDANVGGVIGYNDGNLFNSFASGDLIISTKVGFGGIIGQQNGVLQNSFIAEKQVIIYDGYTYQYKTDDDAPYVTDEELKSDVWYTDILQFDSNIWDMTNVSQEMHPILNQ